jgi:hypothetical protein
VSGLSNCRFAAIASEVLSAVKFHGLPADVFKRMRISGVEFAHCSKLQKNCRLAAILKKSGSKAVAD